MARQESKSLFFLSVSHTSSQPFSRSPNGLFPPLISSHPVSSHTVILCALPCIPCFFSIVVLLFPNSYFCHIMEIYIPPVYILFFFLLRARWLLCVSVCVCLCVYSCVRASLGRPKRREKKTPTTTEIRLPYFFTLPTFFLLPLAIHYDHILGTNP